MVFTASANLSPTDLVKVAVCLFLLMLSGCHSTVSSGASARVEQVGGDVAWRYRTHAWSAVTPGTRLREEAELRTGFDGTVKLGFDEDSVLELGPDSQIRLESLRNARGGVLVWVSLRRGEIKAQVSPKTTVKRAFSVSTRAAMAVVEGTVFSVRHDPAGVTTVAVEEGTVFVQPESPELYPLNLRAGQQVSLNLSVLGPVVAAGAPPSLSEPEFPYALLDLGQWQVCEVRETEICGAWDWDHGNQQFNATWSDGASAVLKVEALGDGEIILSRVDRGSERLAVRYVGRSAGTDFDGDVAVQLIAGKVVWAERGKQIRGTWRARSYYWIDLEGK